MKYRYKTEIKALLIPSMQIAKPLLVTFYECWHGTFSNSLWLYISFCCCGSDIFTITE